MSQRTHEQEARLERLENILARYARLRKLLAVLGIKARYVDGALGPSMQIDIAEASQFARGVQEDIAWIIAEFERHQLI